MEIFTALSSPWAQWYWRFSFTGYDRNLVGLCSSACPESCDHRWWNRRHTLHARNRPWRTAAVSAATVKLYVAGSTGYGSAATYATGNDLFGNNTVATNPTGGFNITGDYACPTAVSLVYIVASGGNPGLSGTVNNTASVLVAALGACGNLNSNTFININELTTAAAAFALGQFFTPTFGSGSPDTIGAPSSNLIGITNAFATAENLVSTATGTAAPTTRRIRHQLLPDCERPGKAKFRSATFLPPASTPTAPRRAGATIFLLCDPNLRAAQHIGSGNPGQRHVSGRGVYVAQPNQYKR